MGEGEYKGHNSTQEVLSLGGSRWEAIVYLWRCTRLQDHHCTGSRVEWFACVRHRYPPIPLTSLTHQLSDCVIRNYGMEPTRNQRREATPDGKLRHGLYKVCDIALKWENLITIHRGHIFFFSGFDGTKCFNHLYALNVGMCIFLFLKDIVLNIHRQTKTKKKRWSVRVWRRQGWLQLREPVQPLSCCMTEYTISVSPRFFYVIQQKTKKSYTYTLSTSHSPLPPLSLSL